MSGEPRENKRLGGKAVPSLPEAEADRQRDSRSSKSARAPRTPKHRSLRFDFGGWLKNRRLEMTAVIIGLLISNFFVVQAWHFDGRYDRRREVNLLLPFWQALENAELSLYDRRVTLRGRRLPNCLNKIAIVGLDDVSLGVFHQWPIPREWHAELIRRLKKAGAKVIVFDFDFSDKQNVESDAELAKAMAEAGNVIVASHDSSSTNVQNNLRLFELQTPLSQSAYDLWYYTNRAAVDANPFKKRAYDSFRELGIDEQTPDLANAYFPYDIDDAVRRYPIRGEFNQHRFNIGGLAVLAASVYQDLIDGRENKAYEWALKEGMWPTLLGAARKVPLRQNSAFAPNYPDYYTTPIYWWGPSGTFPTYPYSDVKGVHEVNAQGQKVFHGYDEAKMRARFKDRIVFIGATASILKDEVPVPIFEGTENSNDVANSKISGVEMHANVAAMLLDGVYIRTTSIQTTVLMIFALTVLGCLWTVVLRGWVNNMARSMQKRASKIGLGWWLHSWLWFAVYAVFISLPLAVFWQLSVWLFSFKNLWVNVIYPGASLVSSSAVVLMLLFAAETVERRKTIAQLGAYVSPEVRDEILAQPENKYVQPRRVTATMLFTDLEGFTSYSETHEPEQVVIALNDYFDRMVPIVNAHGGNVDKYIGDSVMAFFGFPLPRFDHAAQALLCAIAMQEECARFREDTGVDFYMRIGVHTGELIAGAIGAEKAGHFNYTALGDTVNLASRLEGKNKEFGSWIICSAATYEAAGGIVEAESRGASIKGKSQEVEIFIVHGMHGQPEQDKHWGHELPEPAEPTAGELNSGTAALEDEQVPALKALPVSSGALEEDKVL